jgi:hypothetical protein
MAAAKIKLAALGTGIWYASKSFNRCDLFPSHTFVGLRRLSG